jgi:hypothetical protein
VAICLGIPGRASVKQSHGIPCPCEPIHHQHVSPSQSQLMPRFAITHEAGKRCAGYVSGLAEQSWHPPHRNTNLRLPSLEPLLLQIVVAAQMSSKRRCDGCCPQHGVQLLALHVAESEKIKPSPCRWRPYTCQIWSMMAGGSGDCWAWEAAVEQGQATCLQAKQLDMPLHPSCVLWDQGLLQVSRHRHAPALVGLETIGMRSVQQHHLTLTVTVTSAGHMAAGQTAAGNPRSVSAVCACDLSCRTHAGSDEP